MSFDRSSTKILHPSCSPKNVTLCPTTGPRSSRCGCGREPRNVRKRASALLGWTGALEAPGSASGSFLRRRENRSERDTTIRQRPTPNVQLPRARCLIGVGNWELGVLVLTCGRGGG